MFKRLVCILITIIVAVMILIVSNMTLIGFLAKLKFTLLFADLGCTEKLQLIT